MAALQTTILVIYVVVVLVFPDWITQTACEYVWPPLMKVCSASGVVERRLDNVIYSLTVGGALWGFFNYSLLEPPRSNWLRLLVTLLFLAVAVFAGIPTNLEHAIWLLGVQLAMFFLADFAILRHNLEDWRGQSEPAAYDYDDIKRELKTLALSTGPSLLATVVILLLAKRIFGEWTTEGATDCASRIQAALRNSLPRVSMSGAGELGMSTALREECRQTSILVSNAYLVGTLTALLVTANASFVAIWWLPRKMSQRVKDSRRAVNATFWLSLVAAVGAIFVLIQKS